jgi:Ca2+:H+ antiporter
MSAHVIDRTPFWSWLGPVLASAFVGIALGLGLPMGNPFVIGAASLLLGVSVFAAVHHAEVLALRVGEPFGSLLLAVAVTTIEVALIISIFLSDAPGAGEVARDTVFSAVMIVLNGVVGLSLIVGGRRHHEQVFMFDGVSAALGVLGTLAVLALVLPNVTTTTEGPIYSATQLGFVGAVSLVLYGLFVFVQTVRHRDYFADPNGVGHDGDAALRPGARVSVASGVLLVVALVMVILIAKLLSYPLNALISHAGFPASFAGVVIAAIVLLPEAMASLRAAAANQLQNSLNLALGSAIASIGLTITAVALVAVVMGRELVLGLPAGQMVLLLLSLFISTLTLGTGRTTVLQGAVHLVIFAVFLFLAAVP